MKFYNYKIQWLLSVKTEGDIKHTLNVIKILGHRSFDEINYIDANLNHFDNVSHMMYASEDNNFNKDIRKEIRANKNIEYIELLRR